MAGVAEKEELREILDAIDLHKDGIYTTEQLIDIIYTALLEKRYSTDEISNILKKMFPEHSLYIDSLAGSAGTRGQKLALWFGILSGILLLIFLWYNRRKKKEGASE